MGFADLDTAVRLREFIRKQVTEVIDLVRPPTRWATVVSVDVTNKKLVVLYPDEPSNPVTLPALGDEYGVGDVVSVQGSAGGRYVAGRLFTARSRGGRNVLRNAQFHVNQRGTGVTGITTPTYVSDGWGLYLSSMGTWSADIINTALESLDGATRFLRLSCTTADASPASGDYVLLRQAVEGIDAARLQHLTKPIALSFWARALVTGTFVAEISIVSSANTRNISRQFSISAVDTWQKFTFVLPADTGGAYITPDSTARLFLNLFIGAGSAFTSGTLNSNWTTTPSDTTRVVGISNVINAVNGRWIDFTAVQIEHTSPTPFELVDFAADLAKCFRYYYEHGYAGSSFYTRAGSGWMQNTTQGYIQTWFPMQMRAIPTLTVPNVAHWQMVGGTVGGAPASGTCSAITIDTAGSNLNSASLVCTTAAGGFTAGLQLVVTGIGSGTPRLQFSSEIS